MPVRMIIPTSACPRSRIAAPIENQQQAQHLRLGGGVHPRQGVGEADHADGGRQRQRRATENQDGAKDVGEVRRRHGASSVRSTSRTRKRAMLTEPTKLISASAARL